MNVAFLGLGGNIGDRLENLQKMKLELNRCCGEIKKHSGIYETDAWGSESQNKYLNQVVELHTPLNAEELLESILKIEQGLGRERTADQNSDRTADIDILLFNDAILDFKHIQIPHPRLHLRQFVLIPLNEIGGRIVHPLFKKTIRELLNDCKDSLNVKLVKNS